MILGLWKLVFGYIPDETFQGWGVSITKGSSIPKVFNDNDQIRRVFDGEILRQKFPKALYKQVDVVGLPVVKIPSIPREYIDYVGQSYIKGDMSRFQDMYGRQGIIAKRKNGGHFIAFQRYSSYDQIWAICFYDAKGSMVDARRFRYESGETFDSLSNEP
jgi:hypothetical protein